MKSKSLSNEAAQYFDGPPLDAYMDDMPPPSEDDGSLGREGFVLRVFITLRALITPKALIKTASRYTRTNRPH